MSGELESMLQAHRAKRAWLKRIDRASWAVALFSVLSLLTMAIIIGRLDVGYLMFTLLAAISRVVPVTANSTYPAPSFLTDDKFSGPEHLGARTQAHEALKSEYLEDMLVSAGKWRQEEERDAMTMGEVEEIAKSFNLDTRNKLFRGSVVLWAAVASLTLIVILRLEYLHQTGVLKAERGLIGLFLN